MTERPVIALDAMGGDRGAPVMVEAAAIARDRYPDLRFRLFGDAAAVGREVARFAKLQPDAVIVQVDGVVLGTDKPSQAMRRAKSTSMGQAVAAVKAGDAAACVSAGNTGALMAIAKLALRTMDGIDRPALVALIPTRKNDSVMLDLGANTECDAANLVQFAVMGAAFARIVLGLDRPRVALLNIGEEAVKGTDALRDAAALLSATDLPMDFQGFIEGDRIGRGDTDVIVTDGFSGNIALKTAEGTAKLVTGLLGDAFRSSLLTRLGYLLSRGALRALNHHLDPNNHNGAVFLGLKGIVVKSHGGASAKGVAHAIGVARDLALNGINARIAADLARFAQTRAAVSHAPGAAA